MNADASTNGTIRIVQLYPAQLGVTGDRGNARAVAVRLRRAGLDAVIIEVGVGEPLPADPDIVILGNGPLSAMRAVADDLRARRDALGDFVSAGGALLTVGGSAELLGSGIDLLDGSSLDGLGLFPFRVARTRERKVGYIIVDTDAGRIVGFEDHASEWTPAPEAQVFGAVAEGRGSFDRDGRRGEIVRVGNAFATNVQGPALPLNPLWSDLLIAAAAARRGLTVEPAATAGALDEYAASARATIERLIHEKKFSTIGL